MKTLMVCYVVAKILDADSIGANEALDWSLESSLVDLEVNPVIVTNRRHNILNDKYLTATELQAKHASASILKRPRALIQAKKVKQTKKKAVTVPHMKKKSKHNKVWTSLSKPIEPVAASSSSSSSHEQQES
jgi:hypothetical protein